MKCLCFFLVFLGACQLNKNKSADEQQDADEQQEESIDIEAVTFDDPESVVEAVTAAYQNYHVRCGHTYRMERNQERDELNIRDYTEHLLVPLIAREQVRVNHAQLHLCLEALLSPACEDFLPEYLVRGKSLQVWRQLPYLEPACRDIFEGTVPLDEPCLAHEHCALGLMCRVHNGGSCSGQCVTGGEVSDDCTGDYDCAPHLLCLGTPRRCKGRSIEAGESCNGLDYASCTRGTYCASLTSGDVCLSVEDLPKGEPTSLSTTPCRYGCTDRSLTCVVNINDFGGVILDEEDHPVGHCEPRGIELGEPCPVAVPDMCNSGLVCSADAFEPENGLCIPAPGENEPCGFGNICGPGFVCAVVSIDEKRCKALRGFGQSCEYSGQCSTGFCDGDSQPATCQFPRDEGLCDPNAAEDSP